MFIDSLFTALIDALANAFPHHVNELGGRVYSVATDGRSRLVIHDASTIRTSASELGEVYTGDWPAVGGLMGLHEALHTMRFDVEYAGLTAVPVAENSTVLRDG